MSEALNELEQIIVDVLYTPVVILGYKIYNIDIADFPLMYYEVWSIAYKFTDDNMGYFRIALTIDYKIIERNKNNIVNHEKIRDVLGENYKVVKLDGYTNIKG